VKAEMVELQSMAESAMHPATGYCQGTPLRNELESHDASCLTQMTEAAAAALAQRFGTGPIHGRMQALVIEATK